MAATLGTMKSTFLNNEKDLRHYLSLAIAEASDLPARDLEQKWIIDGNPTVQDLQDVSFLIYRFPHPLTPESFQKILTQLRIPLYREPQGLKKT